MKDLINVFKKYNTEIINIKEFIIIDARNRYKPKWYNEDYNIILNKTAIIESYNDFYFSDEENIPIQLQENITTNNC